jgi:ORF6N domain
VASNFFEQVVKSGNEKLEPPVWLLKFGYSYMTKRNKEVMIPAESVINKIYLIRDQKVMLDRDLAILYDVETRVLNQAVRRHAGRFPNDFMFQLTKMNGNL